MRSPSGNSNTIDFFSVHLQGVADSPFVSPVGFFDILGEAGRHNHYLQSFGTVDRQLELHVRALALSIELVKCSPSLLLPVSIILCSCIPFPFETLPVVFTCLP